MKNARWYWRVAAILVSILATASFVGSVMKGSAVLSAIALVFASIGVLQYAFGWPKISRTVWRAFGPLFSILMIWSLARNIGWLGTRLVVRQLTVGQQASTIGALMVTAAFGAIVVVPLYRLGEWKHLRGSPETPESAVLRDTFG